MRSHARIRSCAPSRLALSGALLALLATVACSSGSSSNTGGSGGDKPSSGTGGSGPSGGSAPVSTGGTSAGGMSAGGSTGGTSNAAIGGTASGGTASGGTTSGGTSGISGSAGQSAAAGSGATAGGSAGGAGNCAGRSLALLSNGTNSDSDAAYSRVVIDMGSALPIGNAKRTVEFWAYIKSTDWVGDKNEIYYYGASGTTTAFGMDFGTNAVMGMPNNHATLNPFTDGGFNVDSTADLGINSSSNQWVHIAMTWDGAALVTYVNGKAGITSNGSGSTSMLATASGALMIGCNPENKACFNGYFDEFSVWNVARTATEIKDSYTHPLT